MCQLGVLYSDGFSISGFKTSSPRVVISIVIGFYFTNSVCSLIFGFGMLLISKSSLNMLKNIVFREIMLFRKNAK